MQRDTPSTYTSATNATLESGTSLNICEHEMKQQNKSVCHCNQHVCFTRLGSCESEGWFASVWLVDLWILMVFTLNRKIVQITNDLQWLLIDYANSGAIMFSFQRALTTTVPPNGLRVCGLGARKATNSSNIWQSWARYPQTTRTKIPQNAEGSDQITGQIAMIPFSWPKGIMEGLFYYHLVWPRLRLL